MATGSKNYSEVGDIKRWKGSNRWRYSSTNNCFVCVKINLGNHGKEQHQLYLLIFRTIYPSTCGDLRGTSAGFTPVDPGRQFVDYFSTDICRSKLHLLMQCSNLTARTKKYLQFRPIRFQRENEDMVEGVKGTRFVLNATDTFGKSLNLFINFFKIIWFVHRKIWCKLHLQ